MPPDPVLDNLALVFDYESEADVELDSGSDSESESKSDSEADSESDSESDSDDSEMTDFAFDMREDPLIPFQNDLELMIFNEELFDEEEDMRIEQRHHNYVYDMFAINNRRWEIIGRRREIREHENSDSELDSESDFDPEGLEDDSEGYEGDDDESADEDEESVKPKL